MDEPLISLYGKKTEFEKRLFAERHVKDLLIEIGKLKAYIEELEDHKSKHSGNDPKWTEEEKKFIRRDEQVSRLRDINKKLRVTNKKLKKTNSTLISRLYSNGKRIREIGPEKD
jgi:predicted RNase H-like nuclease (RuvC/YqgF family)